MSNSKLLSSLSYFSVFFAPLLLPLIIYFAANEFEVRRHAKKAFVSHIVPIALLIGGITIMSSSIFSFDTDVITNAGSNTLFWGFIPLLFIILYSLLLLSVVIWNVYKGIKVLK